MAGHIPEDILDKIRENSDIVNIVSGYIPLKKAGRNFKAPCPFHNEKTPSFIVSPDKQIYHCFGCGEGGNVITFVMKYERMEFHEAAKFLAQKASIVIPETYSQAASQKNQILKALESAVDFYHQNLAKEEINSPSKAYMRKRSITDKTISEFKIGLASDSWDGLINFARKNNVSKDLLEKAGLIVSNDSKAYDRFRGRLMFPIFSQRGQAIGFGARVLDDSLPKYINSPETEVFSKGKNLFGLNVAASHIAKKDFAIIVEGYLDQISVYQAGVKNVVATLGTSLTLDQVRLLKRYTTNVVLIYDPDAAGQLATLRGLDILLGEDLNIKIVRLPDGSDPDKFVNEKGAAEFSKLIDSAQNLFEYKLSVLLSTLNKDDAFSKAKIVDEMLSSIARVNNEVLKTLFIKLLGERLGLDEQSIRSQLNKVKPKDNSGDLRPEAADDRVWIMRPAERLILSLMLENKDFIVLVKDRISPFDFQDACARKILSKLFEIEVGDIPDASKLIDLFEDDLSSNIISNLAIYAQTIVDKEKALFDCINRLKQDTTKQRNIELCNRIKFAEQSKDQTELLRLLVEYNNLIKNM